MPDSYSDKNSTKDIMKYVMNQQHVSKAELARRVGKAPASVSGNLMGEGSMRCDTLCEYLRALGCELIIRCPEMKSAEWKVDFAKEVKKNAD